LQPLANQTGLDVWDMGCGCGAIGLLAAVHEPRLRLLFSDIDQRAIDCTGYNAEKLLPPDQTPQFVRGNLFEVDELKQKRFHLIAFNPPFLPVQDLSFNPTVDAGGNLGLEIAERYCEAVYDHLEVDGWSVLALADYVDNGKIKQILGNRFGASNVVRRERVILYPFKPEQPDVPAAYEVRYRSAIEQACRYRFETCVVGKKRYLAFKMRHYLAQRK
jgi:methylase of polypeptide subunit release factors